MRYIVLQKARGQGGKMSKIQEVQGQKVGQGLQEASSS